MKPWYGIATLTGEHYTVAYMYQCAQAVSLAAGGFNWQNVVSIPPEINFKSTSAQQPTSKVANPLVGLQT